MVVRLPDVSSKNGLFCVKMPNSATIDTGQNGYLGAITYILLIVKTDYKICRSKSVLKQAFSKSNSIIMTD